MSSCSTFRRICVWEVAYNQPTYATWRHVDCVEFDAQISAADSSRSTETSARTSTTLLQCRWTPVSAADDVISQDSQWPWDDLWLSRDLRLHGDHVYCCDCLPKPAGKLTRYVVAHLSRIINSDFLNTSTVSTAYCRHVVCMSHSSKLGLTKRKTRG